MSSALITVTGVAVSIWLCGISEPVTITASSSVAPACPESCAIATLEAEMTIALSSALLSRLFFNLGVGVFISFP